MDYETEQIQETYATSTRVGELLERYNILFSNFLESHLNLENGKPFFDKSIYSKRVVSYLTDLVGSAKDLIRNKLDITSKISPKLVKDLNVMIGWTEEGLKNNFKEAEVISFG